MRQHNSIFPTFFLLCSLSPPLTNNDRAENRYESRSGSGDPLCYPLDLVSFIMYICKHCTPHGRPTALYTHTKQHTRARPKGVASSDGHRHHTPHSGGARRGAAAASPRAYAARHTQPSSNLYCARPGFNQVGLECRAFQMQCRASCHHTTVCLVSGVVLNICVKQGDGFSVACQFSY